MSDEIKRGPGRPPKVHAEPEPAGPVRHCRVKVMHYKIPTSQGRYIEGQFAYLPPDEAAQLAAIGHVKLC